MRDDLPTGTVTFLFTDVEGSTKLLNSLGAEAYAESLAEHRRVIREACAAEGGFEVDTQGDAFFFAFPTAPGGLAAAAALTEALSPGPIYVRVGLHTGTPLVTDEGYVGEDVHRAARIAAVGHGGQVLVAASTAALVGLDGLLDLGEHRFKDLGAPERIFQLGGDDFPALKSLYRTNLPVPVTPFLGRAREIAEVVALLAREDVRLLTLTGPGGTGKTRLALQAAAEASDSFPDGVFWVPLAPLRDPGLVLTSVAHALEVNEEPGELVDTLASQLAGKRLLLVLDNAEHLLPELASTLAALAAACPALRVLVTSRESIQVAVEIEHPVPTLEPADGVALFRQRAAAHGVDVAPSQGVDELCARLDGLPLALELAAARTKLFSPEQLLERISQRLDLLKAGRDADPRQQTLRATIEWSHDLLSDEEQELFCRLSVFAGGCTYEAAEDVAGADPDTLQSLLDKNLVRRRDSDHAARYWMLETIREYADERLEEGDDEEIRARHLVHFLTLAEKAYEERLASASTWFPRLEAEHDNIRAALDWARISDPQAEAELAGAIAFYWYLQGHAREARERVIGVLGRYQSRDRTRARALTHLGDMPEDMEPGESLSYLDEALSLWREHGDLLGEALALEMIGYTRIEAGEQQLARLAFEQSLALRHQAGASELEASRSLGGLCQMLVSSGEIERAEPMAQELYELGVRNDALRPQQSALHYLADCPLIGGDYAEAESRYVRAVAHARNSGIVVMCATDLLGVAMSAAGRGEHARAVRLAAAAYAQLEAFGVLDQSPTHFWTKLQEWFIGGARAQLTPEDLEAAERAGRAVSFDDILDEVLGTETVRAAS